MTVLVLTYGCSSQRPPPASDTLANNVVMPDAPCSVDGAERECRVVISQHDGITNCLEGKQRCKDGEWSPCMGDETLGAPVTTLVNGAGGLHLQSPGACAGVGSAPCTTSDP